MDIKAYLNEKRDLVDSYLRIYFSDPSKPFLLHESVTYSLFAGGKRVRPILALASYEACGGDPVNILPQACALELIHTYSLIHDDLPAMDNDSLRRGKPTNHKVFGEAMAILAGDALLTEAFSMISSIQTLDGGIKDSSILEVVRRVSFASGVHGMVGGQGQDMLSENSIPDAETLEFIHLRKTAALIKASVIIGPVLAGSERSILDALSSYGEYIGLVFQIVDDILDVEGTTAQLGKTAGADSKSRKLTYPAVYGLEKARQKAEDLVSKAIHCLRPFSSDADPLREIALYLLRRRA
ncbi:MAG TPA: farnesyl diphosphate synthase [Thermodesulfovibrionales bacterium]|nr:farnesyl diphosphate synthase [Thermodesulfovibrionales bacterium]